MIRVLHIVSSLGLGSGVMSFLMNYHRHIDREQVQFDYLYFRKTTSTFEDEITKLGGRIYYCSRPSFLISFKREIDEFFESHQGEYRIIHCHPIFCMAFFAKTAKKYGVCHVIQHSHTTQYSGKRISALRNWGMNVVFGKNATDYVACSEEAKTLFFWKKPEEVQLIPNAIDLVRFRFSAESRKNIRQKYNIGDDEIVIGHVGRFAPEKNHFYLLKVFEVYQRRNPKSHLMLLGDGSMLDEVKLKAKQSMCDKNILFLGRRENLEDFYSAMDVFILPSRFEGLGIALVEAQTSGLVCVASDCVPRIVNVSNQVLFIPLKSGEEYWAEKLVNLKKNQDRNIVNAAEFDISVQAPKLVDYYQSLN